MKKLVLIGLVVLVLILGGAIVTMILSINPIIEKAVNTYGPDITKTAVKLDKSDVSLFSGQGKLKGLFIGNPKGFKSASAIEIGAVQVKVDKESLTKDVIVINEVVLSSPKITYELAGKTSNIDALQNNIKSTVGGGKAKTEPADSSSKKKVRIDNFYVKNGQINLALAALGGKGAQVNLPDIHLTNIGQDGGVSFNQAFAQIMKSLNLDITKAVSTISIDELTKEAQKQLEGAAKGVQDLPGQGVKGVEEGVKGVEQGLKNLFGGPKK